MASPRQDNKSIPNVHSRELKTLHQKLGILGFHNKFMMLIFIYKTADITWLQFMFSFSHQLLRLVYDVTWYVICITRLWPIVRNFRAKFRIKLNAPDD